MKIDHQCPDCKKELKFGEEKIVQTSERGIHGIYHKDCYDKVKMEKLNALSDL